MSETVIKIFDAHFHIIDNKYHLQENNGYLPDLFTYQDYKNRTKNLFIDSQGGAIISGSFQGNDLEYLEVLNEFKKDGKKDFRAIINLPIETDDKTILDLNEKGVVGVRFNIFRGNSTNIDDIINFSKKIHHLCNWHVEIQIDPKNVSEIINKLLEIPRLSIDHIGLKKEAIDSLYILAKNNVKIKASGFGRLDFEPIPILKNIYEINPFSLMFGTDLPSTRVDKEKIFSRSHIDLMINNFSEEELKNIVYNNAYNWYINRK